MKHGLTIKQLDIIRHILSTYSDVIERVDLFGSRATGNYSSTSDIDLVLHGSLTEADINRLWTLFQESQVPYSVDVMSYELTDYEPLKAHMDKVCYTLFFKKDLYQTNQ